VTDCDQRVEDRRGKQRRPHKDEVHPHSDNRLSPAASDHDRIGSKRRAIRSDTSIMVSFSESSAGLDA
jgi:hypothetical protein